MKSRLLSFVSFFFLLITSLVTQAQDAPAYKFADVTPVDFQQALGKSGDSSAHAVVIADVGNLTFVGNKLGWFSSVLKRKTRILILKADAFEAGTVHLDTYANDESAGKIIVENIVGASYNLENGKVVKTSLTPQDIFNEKLNKYYTDRKFSLPGLKEGSIIEYSYTQTSDFIYELPTWDFQQVDYPTVWSDFTVVIPSLLVYQMQKQGGHEFFFHKQETGHEIYRVKMKNENSGDIMAEADNISVNTDNIKSRWVMKNVSGLHPESYISTARNYIDQLQFQLIKTFNGQDVKEMHNSWNSTNKALLANGSFGFPLAQENQFLAEQANKIAGQGDFLERASRIYYYLTSNFVCTSYRYYFIQTTLNEVFQKKKGNVGELNLLLTAMLRSIHIKADPVLLSTREHGLNSPAAYFESQIDHVISRATIQGKIYYLDASYPLLGFGKMATNCYNGHARVISEVDSMSVYFMSDSIRDIQINSVYLGNDPDHRGQFKGNFSSTPGYQKSYDDRRFIVARGEENFWKPYAIAGGQEIKISNAGIDSLHQLGEPINVHFDFAFASPGTEDRYYFNPIFYSGIFEKNPLAAAERTYPVEMDYPIDKMYILNMETPSGYQIEEMPQSARVAYNDKEGMYEYLIGKTDNGIQLKMHLKMKKANFYPEEYNTLRDFFNFIVKKNGEQIVFKKKG